MAQQDKLISISQQIKEETANAVLRAFDGIKFDIEDVSLEHPSAEEHGDYSTSVALQLAKKLNLKPREIAEKIVRVLKNQAPLNLSNGIKVWDKVEVAGPGFINFWLAKEKLIGELDFINKLGTDYGRGLWGAGKTMVIDYSAPNIAKRFGIGHLRSTIIGQALYNLYHFSGFKTIGDNHLGDWGTQFGKLIYMIIATQTTDLSIDNLEKLYVDFHRLVEQDPSLEDEARECFKKLEEGDSDTRNLWLKCIAISNEEFARIYELLGVHIDNAYGESTYEAKMLEVIGEAKATGVARQSQGAWIIEVPESKAPLILVKSDGATTYATRDLATLKFRKERWNPDLVIYEVGGEQALHFVQVFSAARMLGYVGKNTELIHTKHGLYRWAHGKMKTREGTTIKLESILDEAIKRAAKLGNRETARAVGIGAIKYFDLSHNVSGDIIFDWEKMFSLQGDSGPYIQYTYARALSVLNKAGQTTDYQLQSVDLEPQELTILRYLYRFPEVVELAAKQFAPNLLCTYLFELAKRYNSFYAEVPILGTDQENFRLRLTRATSVIIKNGLNLLGIEVLERM